MKVVWSIVIHLLFLCFTNALYEDQVGKFDWKQQFIGKVEDVEFDNHKSLSGYAYMKTDKNVLARVKLENGVIHNRKIFSKNDGHVNSISLTNDGVLTVTDTGLVRVWGTKLNELRLEINLKDDLTSSLKEGFKVLHSTIMHQHYTKGDLLVVLTNKGIFTTAINRNKATNFVSATEKDSSTDISSKYQLLVDSNNHEIFHVSELNAKLVVSVYESSDLQLKHRHEVPLLQHESLDKVVLLESGTLIIGGMDSLRLLDIKSGYVTSNVKLSSIGINANILKLVTSKSSELSAHGTKFAVWRDDNEISTVLLQDDGSLKEVWSNKFDEIIDVQVHNVASEKYIFVSSVKNGKKLLITPADFKKGEVKKNLRITYNMPASTAKVAHVRIEMFLRRSTPVGFRALVQFKDDSMMLVENPNRVLWVREESLSSIQQVKMIDLPVVGNELSDEKGNKANVVDMFVKRVTTQYNQLKSYMDNYMKELNRIPNKNNKKSRFAKYDEVVRDEFSFDKIIFVVTNSATVYGLDSKSGDIVWRKYIPSLHDRKVHIMVQRASNHYPNPPLVTVVGLKKDHHPAVVSFQPINGKYTDHSDEFSSLKSSVMQAVLLPSLDDTFMRPILLVLENNEVSLFPRDTSTEVMSSNQQLYVYNVNKNTGVVTGFKIDTENEVKTELAWNFKVPESHKIIACSSKFQNEKVNSMGRPLADRSVIYKYLNPNLAAIVSQSTDNSIDKSNILLHVIDTVTGEVIYSQVHAKCSGPVQIVNTENWIMYSYRNLKQRRNEISSLEFYEGHTQVNSTEFSSFQQRLTPTVMQQSYIFHHNIDAMQVTRTERGITTRQLIFALRNGQLYSITRKFFDPRRPLHPGPSDREEGLIPYQPQIPVVPEWMLSYNQTISNVHSVYTAPTALESTSLVFATGLDLFFTRTQPSKQFDVLKDDFDHLLISSVVIGMFVCVFIIKRFAQMKQLQKAWR